MTPSTSEGREEGEEEEEKRKLDESPTSGLERRTPPPPGRRPTRKNVEDESTPLSRRGRCLEPRIGDRCGRRSLAEEANPAEIGNEKPRPRGDSLALG